RSHSSRHGRTPGTPGARPSAFLLSGIPHRPQAFAAVENRPRLGLASVHTASPLDSPSDDGRERVSRSGNSARWLSFVGCCLPFDVLSSGSEIRVQNDAVTGLA